MNRIWDLKENIEHFDSDIESFEYKEIREIHNTSNSSEDAIYDFHISDTNACILYSSGYLHQDLKIVKSDGSSIVEENVTLVNFGGLLRTSTLTIGNTKIDADVDYTSLMMHILGLVNFTPDYCKGGEATNMFYYIDTNNSAERKQIKYSGTLTDATPLTTFINNLNLNHKQNEGFSKRWYF